MRRRKAIRLPGWDYSADGAYFVTICAHRRAHLFGTIVDGQMRLNDMGTVVADTWRWLPTQYPHVVLDEWRVMPNHLHGLLVLTGRGGSRTAPTPTAGGVRAPDDGAVSKRKPVGRLTGAFKTVSTKHVNQLRKTPGAVVWQRDFFDHVVRDAVEMERIRAYIKDNPANWATDELND